jgi:hypothetical protein
VGCLVAGGVAVVGALVALAFLPAQPPSAGEPDGTGTLVAASAAGSSAALPTLEPAPIALVPAMAPAEDGSALSTMARAGADA